MKTKLFVILLSVICFVSCDQKQNNNLTESKTSVIEENPMSKLTGEEFKIVVNYTFKPEYKDELLATFKSMIEATRKEPGCIYYDLHQNMQDSSKYVLLEYWKTKNDWELHKASEHFKIYKEATDGKFETSGAELIKQIY